VGHIPGTKFPNRRVIIGNHRDAWTPGAVAPPPVAAQALSIESNATGAGLTSRSLARQGRWTQTRARR